MELRLILLINLSHSLSKITSRILRLLLHVLLQSQSLQTLTFLDLVLLNSIKATISRVLMLFNLNLLGLWLRLIWALMLVQILSISFLSGISLALGSSLFEVDWAWNDFLVGGVQVVLCFKDFKVASFHFDIALVVWMELILVFEALACGDGFFAFDHELFLGFLFDFEDFFCGLCLISSNRLLLGLSSRSLSLNSIHRLNLLILWYSIRLLIHRYYLFSRSLLRLCLKNRHFTTSLLLNSLFLLGLLDIGWLVLGHLDCGLFLDRFESGPHA